MWFTIGFSLCVYVVLIKYFLDFNLLWIEIKPYITRLSSFICFPFSIFIATFLLITGGAVPLKICSLSIGIGFKHPVINFILPFNVVSTSVA